MAFGNGLFPDGTKQQTEPMLTYGKLDTQEHILMEL